MKKYKFMSALVSVLIFSFFVVSSVNAQGGEIISKVEFGNAFENNPLKVEVELYQSGNIGRVLFIYKSFGQGEFIQKEMVLNGRQATIVIPAEEVLPPFLEYYVKAETVTGKSETWPLGVPDEGTPLQLVVQTMSPKDREVIFLTPEKGSIVSKDDLFISISLLRASDDVDKQATKLFIGEEDVSSKMVLSGDLIIFYPDNFPGLIDVGEKTIKLQLYDNEGELYHEVKSNFSVVSQAEFMARAGRFKYNLDLTGEARNEQFSGEGTFYNNVNADFRASVDSWDIKANVYVSSEEKNDLQPVNRFSASVKSDWMLLEVGDNYPVYPSLIMNGKRLRGVNGEVNWGVFNLQASYGQSERSIEGELIKTYQNNEAVLGSNIIKIDAVKYGAPFGEINAGTFKRNVFAVRPSFGKGENFQFGLSYLHSKDDVNSITFGTLPQENLVIGTDLMFAFDDRNIVFTSQAAVSLLNSDISSGTLTDAQLDSLFASGERFDTDLNSVKDVKDILNRFITVNQFLGPLNPDELASLAAEAGIRLNYVNNNLNVKYIYRGNKFVSFGQPFTRTDVKGINITDRINLIDNKLFVNLGYEKLEDNLQETKQATTDYQTFNASVSVFPRANFPNITVGYTKYQNENGLAASDSAAVDDYTNRFYANVSYDIKTSIRHRVYLNVSTSDREDNSIFNSDAKSTSASFMWNTYWNRDLSSFIRATLYDSEISGEDFDYTTISIGGKYKVIRNKLELSASVSPSFGDFERQALDVTGTYYFMKNLSLDAQFRIYRIPDMDTDSIVGVILRYNI
ncbi:MAG: hypothetical protein ACEPO8_03855 [Rhodothermaceae bacterium]